MSLRRRGGVDRSTCGFSAAARPRRASKTTQRWTVRRSPTKYAAPGFKEQFGYRLVTGVDRAEARDWAVTATPDQIRFATQLFNRAIEDGLIAANPFRGLTPPSPGRSDETPPTPGEWPRLYEAWSALDTKRITYAPMGRALFVFASFTGMRPGELFALERDDVDFDAMRIHVSRRVYHGTLDLPKSNKPRKIDLTPLARDALLRLERYAATVFVGKLGQRLSEATLSNYWANVRARRLLLRDEAPVRPRRVCGARAVAERDRPADGLVSRLGRGDVEDLRPWRVGWEAEWERSDGENVVELKAVGG